MKYIDVFHEIFGEDYVHYPKSSVLAWTANYETGVFDIQEEVHPATKWVWFQWWTWTGLEIVNTIYKCELTDGKWEWGEYSVGNIPFVNYNPFKPRELMASSRAVSQFPQNQ